MKSTLVTSKSRNRAEPPAEPFDRLSSLLERFRVRASLFHTGALCGTTFFEARPGRAFLHVLRRGRMQVRHGKGPKRGKGFAVEAQTLLLYPRPLDHEFVNAPSEGSDLTCATLDFDGGDRNPFVAALPDAVVVPLAQVDGLQPAMDLLFAEADQPRCGSRLLADRMFEVVLIQLLRWLADHPQQAGISSGLIAGLGDVRLARALSALHRAPHEEWTLARMAAVAGMSRSAFADAFRDTIGTTPAAYLTDWRLTLAASRLRDGRSVGLVAAELGFSGTPSLSRAFRNRFGASPREWLQSA